MLKWITSIGCQYSGQYLKKESHGGRGNRWNSVGLTPSSTRGSIPGRPSESPDWHTVQSSPTFSLIADSYVSGDLIISPVWLRCYLVYSRSSNPNKTCFESSVCFESSYVPTLWRNEIWNRVPDSPPIAIIHAQRRHHPSAIFTLQYFIPYALGDGTNIYLTAPHISADPLSAPRQ